MKKHPIYPICDTPLGYFETSRYGTILHTTQRYLERCWPWALAVVFGG